MATKTYIKLERGLLRVSDADRRDFLQGIITNDINKVSEARAIYSLLLTPQGKFLFDFFIVMIRDRLVIDCHKSALHSLKQRLEMYKLRSDVKIEDITADYKIYSVTGQGEDVSNDFNLATAGDKTQFPGGIVFIDPRNEKMGARCIIANDAVNEAFHDNSFTEGAIEDYEKLRISLCLPESGENKDLTPEKSFPLQYNMDEIGAIDFEKGCYVGQEVTARSKHRGAVRKRLIKMEFDDTLPGSGETVEIGGKKIGIMRSSIGNTGLILAEVDEARKSG